MSDTTLPVAAGPAPGTDLILYNPVAEVDDRADPDVRIGAIVAVLFFVLFLGWALFARLDVSAYAPGRLAVSGQRQSVQHRDGGTVGAILVKDGQRVAKGQLLIEMATPETVAQERALSGQMIALKAQRARLMAEQLGTPIAWPAEFATATGADAADVAAAKRLQIAEMNARRAVLGAQSGVFQQQSAQVAEGSQGFRYQMSASAEQERLITDELESLRELADKGYVSKTRIRALERARAGLIGQREQYRANIAQSSAAIGENRLKALEAQRSYAERSASDLRTVEFALNELIPKYNAAKEQLGRLSVRAPAAGRVVGLSVFTVGGVVSAGQTLMDIVPDAAPLIVEARVSVDDADDVRVGQAAQITFPGLHIRSSPQLEGRVTRLSADAFTDEKTGISYFTADVLIPLAEYRKLVDDRGKPANLGAGQPAQIVIPIRKRTAMQYFLEPLTGSLRRSLNEQ